MTEGALSMAASAALADARVKDSGYVLVKFLLQSGQRTKVWNLRLRSVFEMYDTRTRDRQSLSCTVFVCCTPSWVRVSESDFPEVFNVSSSTPGSVIWIPLTAVTVSPSCKPYCR
jgi:hypothetical protein